MDAATATDEVISRARGRKDSTGTEGVIKTTPLKKNLKDACTLAIKKQEAAQKFNDKIKAIAEQTSMQSSVVRKAVMAKVGDKFEDLERDTEQMTLALEAVKDEPIA